MYANCQLLKSGGPTTINSQLRMDEWDAPNSDDEGDAPRVVLEEWDVPTSTDEGDAPPVILGEWDVQTTDNEGTAAQPQFALEGRRGPGRPRGTCGNPLALRATLENQQQSAPSRRQPDHLGAALQSFLRPQIGSAVHRLLAKCVLRNPEELEPETSKLISHCLGPTPRTHMGVMAEAALLQMHRNRVLPGEHALAACVHYGSRLWVMSLISHLNVECVRKTIIPQAVFKYFLTDETTMPVRGHLWKSGSAKEKETNNIKIVQTEFTIAFLFQEVASLGWRLITVPLACPLQSVDSACGETLLKCIKESIDFPGADELLHRFPHHFVGCTMDKAGSNDRAFQALKNSLPLALHLRLPCDAHIISTVCGRTYGVVDAAITGMISFALAMCPGGASSKFRTSIAAVLKASLEVVDTVAPTESAYSRSRDALLKLCLPGSEAGVRRMAPLQDLVHGDIQQETVVWCKLGGASEEEVDAWAARLANNLMPSRPKIFSRTRWVSSLEPMSQCVLLSNVHGILSRAIPHWLSLLAGSTPAPVAPSQKIWEPDSSTDEDADEDDRKATAGDWAAWNRKQRKGARNFARSRPAGVMLVIQQCLSPLVRLLNSLEVTASTTWQEERMKECIDGGPFVTRVEEALSSHRTSSFMGDARHLLFSPQAWSPVLPPEFATGAYSSMAFAMLARSMAGIKQLMSSAHASYPLKLFQLIRRPGCAAAILADPPCLKDSFTRLFLTKWKAARNLQSMPCRLELLSFASMLRLDITRVECRHASIRRCLRSRTQTHNQCMVDASAAFVLMRQRTLEQASCFVQAERKMPSPKEKARRRRRCGRFVDCLTGGGGQRRAALSQVLAELGVGEKRTKEERSQLWSLAHKRVREADVDELNRWAEQGLAGTVSHRHGHAFGPRRKRRCKGDPPEAAQCEQQPLEDIAQGELALVLRHQAQKHVAAQVVDIRRRAEKRRKQETECQEQIAKWSTSFARQDHIIPGVSKDLGAHAAPLGDVEFNVQCLEWVPPGSAMVCRAFGGSTRTVASKFNLRKILLEAWHAQHAGIEAADLEKNTAPVDRLGVCFMAGFCVCRDDRGEELRQLVALVTNVLSHTSVSGLLKPKSAGRVLYDASKVLSIGN